MPIYEYRCAECGEKFEKLVRSTSTQAEIACPKCGATKVEKAFSVFGISGTSAGSSISPSAGSCAPKGG